MHSSSEIEIAAACLAAKRIMFYREMSHELKIKTVAPIPLLVDNSGAKLIYARRLELASALSILCAGSITAGT